LITGFSLRSSLKGEFFEPNLQGAMIERRTKDCQLLYDRQSLGLKVSQSQTAGNSLIGRTFDKQPRES